MRISKNMKATAKRWSWFVAMASLVTLAHGTADSDTENPYRNIAERNAFGLQTPLPPPVEAPAQTASNALPELVLTGIADFSAKKWALLTSTERGKPPRHYTLKQADQQDGLEVLDIDGVEGSVRIKLHGTELVLSFPAQDQQRKEAQAAEKRFVDEHTRGHAMLQRRERERLERDRAYAAAGWDIATGQRIPQPVPLNTSDRQPSSQQ